MGFKVARAVNATAIASAEFYLRQPASDPQRCCGRLSKSRHGLRIVPLFCRPAKVHSSGVPRCRMTNVEYEMIVHTLDAARQKFGLELIAADGAAERIRLLINLTLKASQSAIFAPAVAMMAAQSNNLRDDISSSSACS